MSVFFAGFGLQIFSLFALPLAFLAAAFVYWRVSRDEPVDQASGVTLYVSLLLLVAAVMMAYGLGRFLVGVTGGVDEQYTYGTGEPSMFSGEMQTLEGRDKGDVSAGAAVFGAAGAVVIAHLWLRRRLVDRGYLDASLDGAFQVIGALVGAVFFVVFLVAVFGESGERVANGDAAGSPGEEMGYMWAFLVLAALYLRSATEGILWGGGEAEEEPAAA